MLLTIVTILARRLSVAELGAYGLVASLAGYLLVLRNSVASSAIRAMAAVEGAERRLVFSAAAALYALAGLATGLLIAGAGLLIAGLILSGDLAADARVGGLGLGALTAVGVAASVWLDALRAERQFVRAAGTEIAAVPALPRLDARADLRRRGARRADRGERGAAALQRHAVRAGGQARRAGAALQPSAATGRA